MSELDLDEDLGWTDLSERTLRALRRNGVKTIGQLAAKSAGDLLDLRGNVGLGSFRDRPEVLHAAALYATVY